MLFIADEIQSGLGRTGRLFAHQHEGISPDILILGKALSGGFYPVSAVLASSSILGVFQPGDHGSTFGGNPLACAVARAALQVITDEDLPARSASLGAYALDRLRSMRSSAITAVRGQGLWLALDLNRPARPICEALQARGRTLQRNSWHHGPHRPAARHPRAGPGLGAWTRWKPYSRPDAPQSTPAKPSMAKAACRLARS